MINIKTRNTESATDCHRNVEGVYTKFRGGVAESCAVTSDGVAERGALERPVQSPVIVLCLVVLDSLLVVFLQPEAFQLARETPRERRPCEPAKPNQSLPTTRLSREHR